MTEAAMPEERLGPDAQQASSASGQQGAVAASGNPGNPGASSGGRSPFSPLGANLAPVLARTCQERLTDTHWFRTDWQRGGALTGYGQFKDDDGQSQPVVVKLPVSPNELLWLQRLQEADNVAPRLYAAGETLNGYDMAWVVMERLPHGPLGGAWQGQEFDLAVAAAGRFYAASSAFKPTSHVQNKDYQKILALARDKVHKHALPHEQRWGRALKLAHKKLKQWLQIWHDRPIDGWCHGDFHLANAMTREPAPDGPAVLLDFAHTAPGCWLEDAVYFEHLYWARRDRLQGRKLCSMIAKARRKHGLKVAPDWPRLAAVRRALLAMSTPAMLQHDGDPHHLEAALQVLEIEVAQSH